MVKKTVVLTEPDIKVPAVVPALPVTGEVKMDEKNNNRVGLSQPMVAAPSAPVMVKPVAALKRPDFKDLVPIYPIKQIKLEFEAGVMSDRIIDIFCPIGYGQRGMIASPPKAGKTTLLKEIAAGVAANYPEIHLMAVLVGERPEEG